MWLQVCPGEQKKFNPNLAISKALPATGFLISINIQLLLITLIMMVMVMMMTTIKMVLVFTKFSDANCNT